MGKAPLSPYPPERDEDARAPTGIADLVDAVVEDEDWANSSPVRGAAARRAELRGCRLTGSDLHQANLTDVTFDDCRLDLVNLRHATLARVVFRDCHLSELDLYGASLQDVLFERCRLREAILSSATLERVELRQCDLAGLQGAEALRGARMPWNDVLENAPLFALALGLEIVD